MARAIRYRLGLHRSTLSSGLERLERDGLIRRLPNTLDGRRFEIRLTNAGSLAADTADFVIRDVEAEIAGYASREDRAGAVAVFEACMAIGRRDRGSAW